MPKVDELAKEGGPLAIIAGGGTLPCAIAAAVTAGGGRVHIIGIRGEADETIASYPHSWMKWGEAGKLFATLKQEGCHDLIFIGTVGRPDLSNIKLDLGAIRALPFLLSLRKGGDDSVLSRIVGFIEDKGYRVRGAGEVAPELLAGIGTLGAKAPSTESMADIEAGFRVVEALGRLDVGQAAVVAKGHVLAVEAAEGTDAMLARCAGLRQWGRRPRAGVMVKAPKPGQEERVDLPTIGPDTVDKAAHAGLAGIAVAAGRVLIADRAATIAAADEHGLFLFGQPQASTSDD
ncbi:MAG: UDP-2,3-diacylglucosamine diphosphatase LpxI [Methyloceanibacter sp.]|jgi:DUF1009 family protein